MENAMLHRRSALALLAGAGLIPFGTAPARAQSWRVFSRPGVGFTIELPGEPEVAEETEDAKAGGPPVKIVQLELGFENLAIAVSQTDWHANEPQGTPTQWLDEMRDKTAALTSVPVLSDRRFVQDGFPAAEIAYGREGFYARSRIIVTPKRHYGAIVTGIDPLDRNPVATRVLTSFKLAKQP
jgi:hypothetical protein